MLIRRIQSMVTLTQFLMCIALRYTFYLHFRATIVIIFSSNRIAKGFFV